jgi:Tol biopolymer transport system component
MTMTTIRLTLVGLTLFASPQQLPKVTPLFSVEGKVTAGFTPTRDGRRIYFMVRNPSVFGVATPPGEMRMFDRASHRITKVIDGNASGLSISNARDVMAFTRPGEDNKPYIWTVSLDPRTGMATSAPRRVSLSSGTAPVFSPDGKWIAFGSRPSAGLTELVVFPATGGPERVLLRAKAVLGRQWSPDGRWLYFAIDNTPGPAGGPASEPVRQGISRTGMYRVAVAGGDAALIVDNGDGYPGLSPDGRTIITGLVPSVWGKPVDVGGGMTEQTLFLIDSLVVANQDGRVGGAYP